MSVRDEDQVGLRLVETQPCSRCGVVKVLSEFHRDSKRPNGRRTICRECKSTQTRAVPRSLNPEWRLEDQAWTSASEKLAANHEREFRGLLYTERSVLGLTGLVLPRAARSR